ncbi:MAG: glycerol-3-phosphate dehydrogenase [Amphritea sp.]|nr:glycerol-3-phosphate dehydrogenase [Amphritea sp.]
MSDCYDLLIIGGGINGTGIARDAAGRGLKVALCEMNDLASATSSNSSKLIHGGLRYLEQGEFRLVKEALAEREVLLNIAPHIIWPLRFRLPVQRELRPAWQIRTGLWLYDHLARRDRLPSSSTLAGADTLLFDPCQTVFEFFDAWVDDSRLVILNALSASEEGATILPRHRCISAFHDDSVWHITLKNEINGDSIRLRGKALINAAGPWVESLFEIAFQRPSPHNIRLIKGSHIVVPRLHDHSHAYMLQNADQRIVFVLPFEEHFSLIGTTDVEYNKPPETANISDEETQYLLDTVNQHFTRQLSKDDIAHSYAGVRPLMDDHQNQPQNVTRDYTLTLESATDFPPLLSVFGGKITTYRKLAENALDTLKRFFPESGNGWTAISPLPGGDMLSRVTFAAELEEQYPWLPDNIRQRYLRSYGTRTHTLLKNRHALEELGHHFGGELYQAEVEYLRSFEWARTADDILWRRTKQGLLLTPEQLTGLENYMSGQR